MNLQAESGKINSGQTTATTVADPNQINLFRRSTMANTSLPKTSRYNKICSVDDCVKAASSRLCPMHGYRLRKFGSYDLPEKQIALCSVVDCSTPVESLGFCIKHYGRFKRHGNPLFEGRIMFDDERRFWSYVNKQGSWCDSLNSYCWTWTGRTRGRVGNAYGNVYWEKKETSAHRVSFRIAHGHFPINNCLHHCDNPLCVNPDHLYDGTQKENAQDTVRRQRQNLNTVRGEQVGTAKLTEGEVIQIKKWLIDGLSVDEIHSRVDGVSLSCILNIKYGHNWAWLEI